MAKPIFIIRVNYSLEEERIKLLMETAREKMEDYHVLIVQDSVDNFVFECYNVDNIPESDIEEIKKLLLK